jgi:hypothetical protein
MVVKQSHALNNGAPALAVRDSAARNPAVVPGGILDLMQRHLDTTTPDISGAWLLP